MEEIRDTGILYLWHMTSNYLYIILEDKGHVFKYLLWVYPNGGGEITTELRTRGTPFIKSKTNSSDRIEDLEPTILNLAEIILNFIGDKNFKEDILGELEHKIRIQRIRGG